ncbi:hypothetical protein ACGFIY_29495 [Micromonospora chersina]|uniref:hypothetical protein n=1 Tax=Micromonospora chersina TaxID=47854 RepID=UPI0037183FCA
MWEKVDVPCVGGPVNGRSLLVPVDEDGVPPDVLDQNWLWVEFGGELLDADMAGVYELEPLAGAGPPWIYVWAPTGGLSPPARARSTDPGTMKGAR